MTCKDCIHYEAHKHFFASEDYEKDFDDYFNGDKVEYECPEFLDRSKWAHLPCKVGDTVYCFAPCFDEERQPKIQVTETKVVDIKTIATVPGMEFDIDKIGKTVFLTRDEAEKELEKRRKHEE